MSTRLSRMGAVLRYDLRRAARHKLLMVLSGLSLAMMAGAYWLTPQSVDERVGVGVVAAVDDPLVAALKRAAGPALALRYFADEPALRAALNDGDGKDLLGGVVVPKHLLRDLGAARPVDVRVLVPPEVSPAARGTLRTLVHETTLALAGAPLPVSTPALHEVIVGEDRMGRRVPPRDQVSVLLPVVVLLMELLVLALLIADEIRFGTVKALLATPLSVAELIGAKTVFGTLGALLHLVLFCAAIGGVSGDPVALGLVALLGALMVTGLGLLLGATGRDLQGMTGWLIVALLPLMLPVITIAVPALDAAWVHALPSWPMIHALSAVILDGAGVGAVLGDLTALAAWTVVLLAVGARVLRRRLVRV
jgi:ABC-2 type transport system permease protein